MASDGYTNDELKSIREGWPERGKLCPNCRTRIPRFLDLPEDRERAIRERARSGYKIEAMRDLIQTTGCRLAWAKLWVEHLDGPIPELGFAGTPCFYCGKTLRTKVARMCVACGLDWHDPERVHRIGDARSATRGPGPANRPGREPPAAVDGATVMAWAVVDGDVRPTRATRHIVRGEEMGPAAGLAIARFPPSHAESGVYLFYCGEDWRAHTDTWHQDLLAAEHQAEFEYQGIFGKWVYRPPPGAPRA